MINLKKIPITVIILLSSTTALAQELAPAEASAPTAAPVKSAAAPVEPGAAAPTAPSAAITAPAAPAVTPALDANPGEGRVRKPYPSVDKKFVIGLRPIVGWSFPMGEAAKDYKLSDLLVGLVPVWLDLGYMITPNLMIGAYALYETIPDFSITGIRVGIQAQYHLFVSRIVDPWFGLGIGYEALTRSESMAKSFTSDEDYSETFKGMEFAHLQVGVDFRVASFLTLGPYLSLSFGEYFSESYSGDYSSYMSVSMDHKALHEWLTLGSRFTFYL